ncbi:MAG: prolipoprotein diacylglyceryl transferase [Alphaproteobacteria bacterium]|nr:prolipoprotein diacylglyceryl transferase [Alphaproteobacteria bacterium]
MFAFVFPPLDPILVSIGPVSIHWYAVAYLAGFLLGWRLCMKLARQNPDGPTAEQYDAFLTWVVIGTVLGGRLGYILFYQFDLYLNEPLEALKVWHGGMSFHGGLLGVLAATWLFVRKQKIPFFAFTDLLACATPIGLGLGRLANFVNGELYGRATDMPWAVIFPRGGNIPRHPSQLYEAALEGIVLFVIMAFLARIPALRKRQGFLSGVFLIAYALFRFMAELFREPDAQLGFLYGGITMGQLLGLPMPLFGAFLLWRSKRFAA